MLIMNKADVKCDDIVDFVEPMRKLENKSHIFFETYENALKVSEESRDTIFALLNKLEKER